MAEAKDIVKLNFDRYNNKLVTQNRLFIIAMLLIIINYFLVVESNFSSYKELALKEKGIQQYNTVINDQKKQILKIAYGSDKIDEANFNKEKILSHINNIDHNNTKIDSVNKSFNDIEDVKFKKQKLVKEVKNYKAQILEVKDELSVIKIILFINDGENHFSLFLSFFITLTLCYFFIIRKSLLNLLTRTIRLEINTNNLNEYYEYGVNYSLWLSPLPNKEVNKVTLTELIHILSIKRNYKLYNILWKIFLILLLFLQLRLYFIELIVNKFSFTCFAFLSFLNFILSAFIVILWLSKMTIPDYYNNEEVKEKGYSRRDFITLFLLATPITAFSIYAISGSLSDKSSRVSRLYNSIVGNPRYCRTKKHKSKQKAANRGFEKKFETLIRNGENKKCVALLTHEINKINNHKNNNHDSGRIVRLNDFLMRLLLYLIYHKGEKQYERTYNTLIIQAKKSKYPHLNERASEWTNTKYKWLAVANRTDAIMKWNKYTFK